MPPVSCLLAEIAPATGEPTCVDSTLYAIRSTYPPGANPPIQFDDRGAIYYTGTSWGGRTVLRRYLDGTATDSVMPMVGRPRHGEGDHGRRPRLRRRFADNAYVVGQADLATGEVTTAASATQAWISVVPLD